MSGAQPSGIAALLSDYRRFAGRRLWAALGLMILGALAEGFGLLMIVPLASIAMRDGGGAVRFLPFAGEWSGNQRLAAALSLFLLAMAARSALLLARDVTMARLAAGYEADLRIRAAATLGSRGWSFASRIGQSGMQALLLSDVPRAAMAVSFVQNMAVGATMMVVGLALTLLLSPALTLVALLFLCMAYAVSARSARRSVASGHAISEAMDAAAGSGFRLHAGLKAALAQGTVAAFLDEYRATLDHSTSRSVDFARDYSASRQGAAFGASVAAAILLLVGIQFLKVPLPVLVTCLALFARMSGPAQMLQNSAVQAAAAAPAFLAIQARVGELQPSEMESSPAHPLIWRWLEIEEARFEHEPGLGIQRISVSIEAGQWIGVDGVSGAGKTTLVDLVAGLLSTQAGSIRIDGRELAGDLLDQWRAAIAYVAQDGIVFADSVRGNLLAEGSTADDVELWHALETVGLGQRVRAFPDGLNEHVGDRGSQLSGGERQRLVLARALLRKPSLLILDEATAALDPGSEAQLIERLKAISPRPAALVVAHRESTLSHCDSVISIQHKAASAP